MSRRSTRGSSDTEVCVAKSIAIYSRKSKFTEKGDSIHNQIEQCREHIRYTFPECPEGNILVYEDEGYSGGNVKRPEFQRMMEDIQAKKIGAVVCYRLDRISRNTADFVNILAEFKQHKVSFVSKSDNFDTKTPTGKAMMHMVAVFAELERNTIAERIRDNMYELAKTGRWLGGNTPTGYKSTQFVHTQLTDGKVRKAFMLEQIPQEIDKVRLIFSKYMEYGALSRVETYLLQNQIKTKKGGKFSRFSIKNILQNPVYMIADQDAWGYFSQQEVSVYSPQDSFDGKHGMMAYNKTQQESGSSNEYLDITEWIIAVGMHEGVISGADWVKVHNMLTLNKSKSYRKPKTMTALLSGLLFCVDCGSYMRPKLSKRHNADGELIYDYLCETKEKSKGSLCQMKRLNGNELDKEVCKTVFSLAENIDSYINQLEISMQKQGTQSNSIEQEYQTITKLSETKRRELNSLIDKLAQSDDDPVFFEYVKRKVKELDEELKLLQEKQEDLKELQEQTDIRGLDIQIFEETLYSFANNFESMEIRQKCNALRMLINRIEWDGENANVYFVGSSGGGLDTGDMDEEFRATARGLQTKSS